MQQETLFLLGIVRFLLNNKTVDFPITNAELDWEKVFKLAEKHSIINLVCYGMEYVAQEFKPSEAECENLYKHVSRDLLKSYRQTEAAEEILNAFEAEGIKTLAVKGVCTKKHYPEPDMRTMGDIDILYQTPHDGKVKLIMQGLGYEYNQEGRMHDLYTKKPYVAVEMHRELVASDSEYGSYYANIWDRAKTREHCKHIYEMSLEDEYIYTIVHLVEHFKRGGVGIRFVMDVYVYNCMKDIDWSYIEKELTQLGLWEFYGHISKLAEQWFGIDKCEEEAEPLLSNLGEYIIAGGTFGTAQNAAAISVAKEGRVRFIWKAMFPDLKNMQSMFPWLKKWPILLPYSWALRGVKSICFRRNHIKGQFNKYKHGDEEFGNELRKFFETCGL